MFIPRNTYKNRTAVDMELQSIDNQDSTKDSLLHDGPPPPMGWPILPGVVKSGTLSIVTEVGVDIVLFAMSLSFLAFAIVVRKYNEAYTDEHPRSTNALLDASKYGPSVFPILFACVLGRASHAILVWRLENGERMGVLDVLASSTSLTSTITSQLKLRMLSILGLSLVLLWALSPIGGQGCLRQMTLGSRDIVSEATFTYMVQRGTLDRFDTTDRASLYASVGAVFNAALLAPPATKLSAVDTFGNVKIPRVEEYEASSTGDKDGWYNTSSDHTTFASLVGIPLTGLNLADVAEYTTNIQSRYLYLNCPLVGMRGFFNRPLEPEFARFIGPGATIYTWQNTTLRKTADPNNLAPLNFTYEDLGVTGTSQCLITTTYVEAKVLCAMPTCSIVSIRRSRLTHPPPAYTLLDNPTGLNQNWLFFASNFVKAMDGHSSQATAVQGYLTNPDYPALESYVLGYDHYEVTLPKDLFAARLGQLVNTYWDSMVATYAIPGGLSEKTANMTANLTDTEKYGLAYSATSQGTKTEVHEVIEAHAFWTGALVVASAVMIVASFVSPSIRLFVGRGPDVMLNVSSLATRDSPFVALPFSGSFLDASDRARLVKDVRVRFGDVRADADVGRLAIGTLDLSGVPRVVPVRRTRLYM